MFLVAGIDALGAVAGVKLHVELEAGVFFKDRNAVFFGSARVNCRFEDDNVAFLEHLSDSFGGFNERSEVGLVVLINWRRYGDDESIAGTQILDIRRIGKAGCCL